MRKNNYIKAFCLLCIMAMLLSGCGSSAPKTLYQSESVQVVQNGNKTAVLDLVSDKEYNYSTRLVKRSEAVTEPYTTVDTDTVKVEIIPQGLRVYDKAENTVISIKRRLFRSDMNDCKQKEKQGGEKIEKE